MTMKCIAVDSENVSHGKGSKPLCVPFKHGNMARNAIEKGAVGLLRHGDPGPMPFDEEVGDAAKKPVAQQFFKDGIFCAFDVELKDNVIENAGVLPQPTTEIDRSHLDRIFDVEHPEAAVVSGEFFTKESAAIAVLAVQIKRSGAVVVREGRLDKLVLRHVRIGLCVDRVRLERDNAEAHLRIEFFPKPTN